MVCTDGRLFDLVERPVDGLRVLALELLQSAFPSFPFRISHRGMHEMCVLRHFVRVVEDGGTDAARVCRQFVSDTLQNAAGNRSNSQRSCE